MEGREMIFLPLQACPPVGRGEVKRGMGDHLALSILQGELYEQGRT
jgi:hypothetical protein